MCIHAWVAYTASEPDARGNERAFYEAEPTTGRQMSVTFNCRRAFTHAGEEGSQRARRLSMSFVGRHRLPGLSNSSLEPWAFNTSMSFLHESLRYTYVTRLAIA